MQFFDDGKVGISFESLLGVVRLLTAPAHDGLPDYTASGVIVHMSEKVCKLVGFSGRMSIRHQALLGRSLYELGYRVLYVERAEGGTVVFGEPITEGDFVGWTRVKLEEVVTWAKRRYRLPA